MPRSLMAHIIMWVASVWRNWKSQKLLCAVWACGTLLSGSGSIACQLPRLPLTDVLTASMTDVWKFNRVLDEEHWDITSCNIPVPFMGVEFHDESSDISDRIRTASRSKDLREADKHRCSARSIVQDTRTRDILRALIQLERPKRSSSPRVDHSLGSAHGRIA